MPPRWTAREDQLIAENIERTASWGGWRKLLPGRTRGAIEMRLVKVRRGEASEKPWTDAQRRSLLGHAAAMARDSGHTVAECAAELERLRRAHERNAGKGSHR